METDPMIRVLIKENLEWAVASFVMYGHRDGKMGIQKVSSQKKANLQEHLP